METSLLFKWTFLGWFRSALEDRSHVCIPARNPEPFFRCHIKRRQTPPHAAPPSEQKAAILDSQILL